MRTRNLLPLVATTLLLVAVTALVVRAQLNGDPGVRVSTNADGRMGVHDLTGSEAPARKAGPNAVRPPRSSGAPVVRLRLPSVGITAPIVTGYLTRDGKDMVAPNSPSSVAWYEYSPKPGQGGNAVFSGHVDWVGIGPAVFWRLRSVAPEDIIEVDLADGSTLKYRVETSQIFDADSGPWGQLFSPTAGDDVITLYTCEGAFSSGEYSDRRVVRAIRIA